MEKAIGEVINNEVLFILNKIENNSLSDVVEELALDSDMKELLDMRKGLFVLAKEKLEYSLRKSTTLGEEEDSGVKISNKTRRSQPAAIAKDVVEQYKYIMGMTVNFPRGILSKETRFNDILPPDGQKDDHDRSLKVNLVEDKMRQVELTNLVKEQQKVIDQLLTKYNEQQQSIDYLTEKVDELLSQIKISKRNSSGSKSRFSSGISEMTSSPMVNKTIPNLSNQENYPAFLIETLSKPILYEPPNASPRIKKGQANVSHIDNGGNDITVIHKAKNLSEDIIEDIKKGTQPQVEQSKYSQVVWPSLPSKSAIGYHPDNSIRRSVTPTQTGRSHYRPGMDDQEMGRLQRDAGSRNAQQLRGVKEEQPSTLYLKNIYVEEKDSDSNIESIVKDYARNKIIRTMNAKVIRYRSMQDMPAVLDVK